jgi:hypothetical protein
MTVLPSRSFFLVPELPILLKSPSRNDRGDLIGIDDATAHLDENHAGALLNSCRNTKSVEL